jgi:uncharacterized protein YbbK (DUF523 family)
MENILSARPRLGISACLLGQKVRFDGGHKQDAFLCETFGRFVEWIPVCPEIEVGMGVPRETVRLVGALSDPKMIAERSGRDWTVAMKRFAAIRTNELADLRLSGYVFKKNSPNCGIERVRVYDSKSMPARRGRGLFAAAVMTRPTLLPVEEEGRLNDPALRENFIERVFAYHRWQEALAGAKSARALVEFYTRHKFLLLAHSERHYRRLGHLVAGVEEKFSARDVRRIWPNIHGGPIRPCEREKARQCVGSSDALFFRSTISGRASRDGGTNPRLPQPAGAARGADHVDSPLRQEIRCGLSRCSGVSRAEPKELMLRNHV